MISAARVFEVGLAAVTIIGAWLSSYFGAYFKKKGENLAVREESQRLLEQMRALTVATKTVEAAISEKVWDRQKHWEMKRDALFAAVESLGRADEALIKLSSQFTITSIESSRASDALSEWQTAINLFDEKRRVASLVCGGDSTSALFEASNKMRSAGSQIISRSANSYQHLMEPIERAVAQVHNVARRELGMDNPEGN